jgi:hypothetical protein
MSLTEFIAGTAALDENVHAFLRQALDLPEAEPNRMARLDDIAHFGMPGQDTQRVERRLFQRAVPGGQVDVDLADVDAMVLRVADELCRLVETHRLRIQNRGAEHVGIEGLEPAGGVDQQGEGGGVAFGKAVLAETLDLLEAALGELLLVTLADHAFDHPLAIIADGSGPFEGRHGAAQFIGLARLEAPATMAIFIACSWNRGTPSVLPRIASSSGFWYSACSLPCRRRR